MEALKWLYKQSIISIEEHDEGYVRQGTSSAIVSAIQELNKLEDLYPSDKQDINLSGGVVFMDDVPSDDDG